ncbi:unnamed protein product [Didymodactylos carnosus]|uniref:Vacuolar ATPase assembly integral membrane protein VMA21 homolog n=1 Tax=Didymodactylos carnosus TaxID=1234261 RepID=A0A813NEQ8_9BILA|nr:unnamed protein product [Didymodactylos carnosus]CAF1071262.1 unnamed protein product [Didymodactylos carnosus]CAF3515649.1 unnamed protein product [Didymodactylos carnosus]CAF3835577.1 unnamed protein product [Didymodactylos carnosus]
MSTTVIDTIISNQDDESLIWIVFKKMLFFTLLMIFAPLTSYFVSKEFIFDGFFNMSDRSSYISSVIVTVVVIHVILIGFLVVAFREDKSDKKKLNKKD